MAEATNFISLSQFKQQVDEERICREETIPWTLLPREELMKIISIDRRRSIHGECWLMKSISREGDEFVCFAPRSLIVYIKDNVTRGRAFYFTALGQVKFFDRF